MSPLIAVVHSTPASITPIAAAFEVEFPDARLWNLIDDRLGPDADAAGTLTPGLRDRMLNLIRHGISGGADAVVMACSMYGEVRDVAEKLFVTPVFSSDADMMDEIARMAPRRVAVLASLPTATADTSARLADRLQRSGVDTEVVGVYCEGAAAAAAAGCLTRLVDTLTAAADTGTFDLLCLAQYSLSPAAADLAAKTGVPVVSPTHLAARAVAARLARS
ncbi:hypothetical protein H7J87_19820 [Mycolicibacterium wolinskyi]|uniref:Asp/Glu racemase n=1 Tax=Mycolicibacterium wolinskyi TaxID=59750 RepID=A0A1X2F2N4_9MYCO|nr:MULTISPECIES: aspartate/glutamate racemase family protein [Mycolicibacterium]MCV7287575.1 hypothetical protein [Mycolicibacterium wolinskyi]MCV7294473.1 hypothetical protein [Mycolicibacterium goodii]ORX12628.1 hypothetical protein AWC31_32270 [Mycolicibacterium wolinskyi]